MDPDTLVEKFVKLGLSEAKAKETVKNKSLSSNLSQLIDMAGTSDLGGGVGNLFYHVASKTKPQVKRREENEYGNDIHFTSSAAGVGLGATAGHLHCGGQD